ncbi:MAG: hypothetical protein HC878_00245 [Leptolyngbyaceae cyanobacterium SL_5_14]|nr:hypothetical protein [Leptolyngbyaceae cyanobacterium SL_5_14]
MHFADESSDSKTDHADKESNEMTEFEKLWLEFMNNSEIALVGGAESLEAIVVQLMLLQELRKINAHLENWQVGVRDAWGA